MQGVLDQDGVDLEYEASKENEFDFEYCDVLQDARECLKLDADGDILDQSEAPTPSKSTEQ